MNKRGRRPKRQAVDAPHFLGGPLPPPHLKRTTSCLFGAQLFDVPPARIKKLGFRAVLRAMRGQAAPCPPAAYTAGTILR